MPQVLPVTPAAVTGTRSVAPRPARPACRLAFALFVLVNATLFVRPAEIVASLEALPIYEVLMVCCLVAAWPAILPLVRWRSLRAHPGILCVVGLLPAIVLSHLSHGNLWEARFGAVAFLKLLLYFLLVVGLVNTPGRLRLFLRLTILMILATATLATLRYHGLLEVQGIQALERRDATIDQATGESKVILQLQASGIFSDPNDFSLVLVTALLATVHFLLESRHPVARLLGWGPILVLLGYAFALTGSRGGFLSLLTGALVWLIARAGWRRAAILTTILLPALLLVFAGRQTNISLDENDTAESRIRLWRDGMEFIKRAPVFGIGKDRYEEEAGLVAHNSYVHSYAELGFVGGTLFLGAFLLPLTALCSAATQSRLAPLGLGSRRDARALRQAAVTELTADPRLWRLRACLLGITVAYAVGIFTLSRVYSLSTYLILGLLNAMALLRAARNPAVLPPLSFRLSGSLLGASILWLAFLYFFVRLLVA